MAKVGELARKRYQEKIREYRILVLAILSAEKKVVPGLQKGDLNQTDKRLMLADKSLDLVSYYALMSDLSITLLGMKNEALLNDARKCCYRSIIRMEEIVSNLVDTPFGDYQPGVEAMDQVLGDREKYDLIRKIGYSIDTVKEGFGGNSKWKWSFVELEARYAVVTKNMLNFKTLVSKLDPSHKSYDAVLGHITLGRRLLQDAADAYRQKYELTTRRPDDMQLGINFLAGLRRLHLLLGEAEDSDLVKRKLDVWQSKLNMDMKGEKREQAVRKSEAKSWDSDG